MLHFDGFLPGRGSMMMDVVVVAMFLILPVLLFSIVRAKYRGGYQSHKRLQLVLSVVLLLAVTLFELEVRIYGWRERAVPSPYYSDVVEPTAAEAFFYQTLLGMDAVPGLVFSILNIHLVFAITTPLLWILVTLKALKRFPNPPTPGAHSRQHRFWGWFAAADMFLTALTGWIFYWTAFIAT